MLDVDASFGAPCESYAWQAYGSHSSWQVATCLLTAQLTCQQNAIDSISALLIPGKVFGAAA